MENEFFLLLRFIKMSGQILVKRWLCSPRKNMSYSMPLLVTQASSGIIVATGYSHGLTLSKQEIGRKIAGLPFRGSFSIQSRRPRKKTFLWSVGVYFCMERLPRCFFCGEGASNIFQNRLNLLKLKKLAPC